MRIALSFPGVHRRGGVERVALECANFLASRGHQIDLVATDSDALLLDQKVSVHKADDQAFLRALQLRSFVASSHRIHQTLDPAPHVKASFGMAALPDSVIWMQSVHAEWIKRSKAIRGWKDRIKQRLNPFHPIVLAMERRMLRKRQYRHLIALTERERNHLNEHYAVPAQDVTVLPNGYAEADFNTVDCQAKREAGRRELGYSDKDVVLIFVANEFERKGFRQLCQAVAKLAYPAIKILAVGRLEPQSVEDDLHRLNIGRVVHFTGPSSHVQNFYAVADYFVLPTQYEAWGLVIVEALACGLPVLTSRLAGASEAVIEGSTGYLLDDPLDPLEIVSKLAALLATPAKDRQAISDSVKRFRWSNILPRYESILLQHA